MVRTRKRSVRRRAGFTLIELLVVLAIIAVLLSLTAVAVVRTIGTQQSKDTKSELSRLEAALKKAWRSSADQFAKEPIPATDTLTSNNHSVYTNIVLPMAGGDRLRAKVIWTKLRLKQAFPNNFNEALNPAPLKPLPYFATQLGALGYTTANTNAANPQNFESSACLLMALQRGEDGPGLRKEDIGGGSFFHDFQTGLNNGLTVPALIDGWQKPVASSNPDLKANPLVFVRWPVYLKAPNYNLNGVPQPKFNDADDPTGELASSAWQGNGPSYSPAFQWFTANIHGLAPHVAGTEPQTYPVFPVIASAGPNGQIGFNPIGVTFPNPQPATAPTVGVTTDADDLLASVNP